MSDRTAKRIVKLAVTIVIGTIAAVITTHQAMQTEQAAESAATGTTTVQEVIAVIDGDTIKTVDQMGTEHRVRIIGIDTPEIGRGGAADDCYAQDARTALAHLVDGRSVELVTDPSQGDVDKYDRLLRHVHTDAGNVAQILLKQGAGIEYTYNTPYIGQTEFRAAEAAAQGAGAGLWGACAPAH